MCHEKGINAVTWFLIKGIRSRLYRKTVIVLFSRGSDIIYVLGGGGKNLNMLPWPWHKIKAPPMPVSKNYRCPLIHNITYT